MLCDIHCTHQTIQNGTVCHKMLVDDDEEAAVWATALVRRIALLISQNQKQFQTLICQLFKIRTHCMLVYSQQAFGFTQDREDSARPAHPVARTLLKRAMQIWTCAMLQRIVRRGGAHA